MAENKDPFPGFKDPWIKNEQDDPFPGFKDPWLESSSSSMPSLIPEDIKKPESKSTIGALGRTLLRVPENLVASGIKAVQGVEGASVTDRGMGDKIVNWVEERNQALSKEYENAGDFIPGVISKKDVAELGQNLAFSGASLAGTLAGGAAGSVAGPVGTVAGGMAGGGLAAHRMQSYSTMNEWLNKKNDESIKQFGRGITKAEEADFKKKFEKLASESGLWEAGPEAVGNVLEIALWFGKRTPVGQIASLVPKTMRQKLLGTLGRVGGTLATEEATETVTQMGQHNVEVKAGTTNEPERSFKSGADWLKSAGEVLPQVLLLSGFMSAGGGAYRAMRGEQKEGEKPSGTIPPETKSTIEGIRKGYAEGAISANEIRSMQGDFAENPEVVKSLDEIINKTSAPADVQALVASGTPLTDAVSESRKIAANPAFMNHAIVSGLLARKEVDESVFDGLDKKDKDGMISLLEKKKANLETMPQQGVIGENLRKINALLGIQTGEVNTDGQVRQAETEVKEPGAEIAPVSPSAITAVAHEAATSPESWETFTPNEYGYQSRTAEGLKKEYFVAQQSPDRFDIIESEKGSTRGIVSKENGKWKFKPEVPEIGKDKIQFKPTEKTFNTPQEAVLEFNRYKDIIDAPESVPLSVYKEFGTEKTHRNAVVNAVNLNKPVPESVLKDYPDLIPSKPPIVQPGARAEGGEGKEKEPWEMTRGEYYQHNLPRVEELVEKAKQKGAKGSAKFRDYLDEDDRKFFVNHSSHFDSKISHFRELKQALSEGKPVPPEVLKDYPELIAPATPLTSPAPEATEKAHPGGSLKEPFDLNARIDELGQQGKSAKEIAEIVKGEQPDTNPDIVRNTAINRMMSGFFEGDKKATHSLPLNLSGAKPRYSYGKKQFDLKFENDIDKAAFITAQDAKSKNDAAYLNFVKEKTGLSDEEVRAHGRAVKQTIKALAADHKGKEIGVPGHGVKKVEKKGEVKAESEDKENLTLKGRWQSRAIERIDKEGNQIVGPAMGELYSYRVVYEHAGQGKPLDSDIDQLKTHGFKKSKDGKEWIGPVELYAERFKEKSPEREPVKESPAPEEQKVAEVTREREKVVIERAFTDWMQEGAYIDNAGNYRIPDEGSKRGPVAPWNKEVKKAYPKPEDFMKAAKEFVESQKAEPEKFDNEEFRETFHEKHPDLSFGGKDRAKAEKTYLLEAIDEIIKNAPEQGVPNEDDWIRIDIPGDGTFRVPNRKDILETFKKNAKRFYPSQEELKPKKMPSYLSTKATGKSPELIQKEITEEHEKTVAEMKRLKEEYAELKERGIKEAKNSVEEIRDILSAVDSKERTLKSVYEELGLRSRDDIRKEEEFRKHTLKRRTDRLEELEKALGEIAKRIPGEKAQPAPAPQEEPGKGEKIEDFGEKKSLTSVDELFSRLYKGEVAPDELKAAFKSIVESKDALVAELDSMTKDALLKRMGGMLAYRYKGDKKSVVVEGAYRDILSTFTLSRGLTFSPMSGKNAYEDALQKMVDETTEADIKNFAEQVAASREEYRERLKGLKKALENPETLDEFKTFIEAKGIDALSAEQRRAYDEVVSESIRTKKQEQAGRKAEVQGVGATVGAEIIETKHTQKGHDLFVVQLAERVEKEVYNKLNTAAKKMGGYYSSYKGNGAVPGFQFKTREDAEAFQKLASEGDTQAATEIAQERKEVRAGEKETAAVEKLRTMSASLKEKAEGKLGQERLTNTARRARMANGAENQARADLQIAETMGNIADAIEAGEAKHLEGLRTKVQVELLNRMVGTAKSEELSKKYTEYSDREKHKGEPATEETADHLKSVIRPTILKEQIRRILNKTLGAKGTARLSQKWQKNISGSGESYTIQSWEELEELKELNKASKNEAWWIGEEADNAFRLKSMGIENPEMERAALREFITFRAGMKQADKAKMLERSLIGSKVGIDFFPTPRATAERMVQEAGIKEGMDVLEPSAGNGNIAEVIKGAGVNPDVVEVSSNLREVLEAKGFNLVGRDFMDYSGKQYDRIIMNPPFSNNQDIDHVRHAYDLLKPGGRLVAIMGEGAFFRTDKAATEFREWLDEVGGTEEKLPEGTFNDRTLMATTGVNARLVIIGKTAPTEKGVKLFAAAWHGSPHTFDKFSSEKIGTGEGAAAYGYGLYFAGKKEVADYYEKMLADKLPTTFDVLTPEENAAIPEWLKEGIAKSGGSLRVAMEKATEGRRDFEDRLDQAKSMVRNSTQPWLYEERVSNHVDTLKALNKLIDTKDFSSPEKKGHVYHVELAPKEDEYLLWDKPISEQSEKVKGILKKADLYSEGHLSLQEYADKFRQSPEDVKSLYEAYLTLPARDVEETGQDLYQRIRELKEDASLLLLNNGIRGIKYLDGSSRRVNVTQNKDTGKWFVTAVARAFESKEAAEKEAEKERSYNYVIFSDEDVSINAKYALNKPTTAPNPLTLSLVQKAFPGRPIKKTDYGYSVILPGGREINIDLVEKIVVSDRERLQATKDYGKVIPEDAVALASFQKIGEWGLIQLTPEGETTSLHHEVFHAAELMALNKNEIAILERKYGNIEQRAEAYQNWINTKNRKPNTFFQRILNFANRVLDLFRNTPESIFRDVQTGKVWEGLPESAVSGNKVFMTSKKGAGEKATGKTPMPEGGIRPWQMTKAQFERAYRQHIDIRSQTPEQAESVKNAIMTGGFQRQINVNALPIIWPHETGWVTRYMAKQGQMVYLVPKAWIMDSPNGLKVKTGWKPEPDEVVTLKKNQSLHEAIIERAIEEGKGIPAKVLKEYPDLNPNPSRPPESGGRMFALAPSRAEELAAQLKASLAKPATKNNAEQEALDQRLNNRINNNPFDEDAINQVYSGNTLQTFLRRFTDSNGKFKPNEFWRKTGIDLRVSNPKDLNKYARRIQVMQDLAANYPAMRALLQAQTEGEGHSNQLSIKDRDTMEPYFTLKEESVKRVNSILFEGDAKQKIYSNEALKEKGLDESEIAGYWAYRKAMDQKMHQVIIPNALQDGLSPEAANGLDMEDIIKIIKSRNNALSHRVERKEADQKMMERLAALEFTGLDIEGNQETRSLSEKETKFINLLADWAHSMRGYVPHEWDSQWRVKVVIEKPGKDEALEMVRAKYAEVTEETTELDRELAEVEKAYTDDYLLDVPTVRGNVGLTRESRQRAAERAAIQVVREKLNLDEKTISQLAKDGKVLLIRSTETPLELFEGAKEGTMKAIVNAATEKVMMEYEKDMPAEHRQMMASMRQSVQGTIEEFYLSKGWGRHLLRRKNTLGYSEDLRDATAKYLSGVNAYVAKREKAIKFGKIMTGINPMKTPELWSSGSEYVSDMLGPARGEARYYKNIVGLFYLAGDISNAALNMTQNFTHAVALLRKLAPQTDKVTADREIVRAMKDVFAEYVSTKKNKGKLYKGDVTHVSQEEADFLRTAMEQGHLDPQAFGELTGFHMNKVYADYWTKMNRGLYALFTGSEAWNRMSTALAAYRRGQRAGIEDPATYALDLVNEAHGIYGRGNRPELVRKGGAIGNILYTFMTYPMINISFIKHRVEDLMRAHSPEQRKVAMKVIGSNLAYVFAFGGLSALPFAWLAKYIWKAFMDPDDDWEKLIYQNAPQPLARGITRGIPAVFGNDMSWKVEGTDILGPPIGYSAGRSIVRRIYERGIKPVSEGDYWHVLLMAMPDFIMNPYRAYFAEGGSGKAGHPVIKYEGGEQVLAAMGFSPTREGETRKAQEIARDKQKDYRDTVSTLADRYNVARRDQDREAFEKVRMDLREHNEKEREKGAEGVLVKLSEVIEAAKRRRVAKTKPYDENLPKYMRKFQREVGQSFGLDEYGVKHPKQR